MSTSARKKRARQEMHAKQKKQREYEKLVNSIKPVKMEFVEYAPKKPYVRNAEEYRSLSTSDQIPGACVKKEANEYSGDYIVGIATMHKSNLVPVGRGDDPKAYAQMRR